ncbi:MAG TPA: alkaline phosphatase family protein [Gemmatimonadales bacterium]|nr:alkaline phosphatase family protein [Gemmatimonadales bacterium]
MTRALLLLIDGLRADVAESELAAGRLPHLQALTTHGARRRAATVFPSTTSVAYLPFLTGCLPGRCNVPSIRWLDRTQYRGRWWQDREAVRSYCGYQAGRLDTDIAPEIPTIFDLVPESVAIFSMITRGLRPDADRIQGARKFWGTVSHYTENHQPGDDAVARELLRLTRTDWRFGFAQFPAVDGHTHAAHPTAPRVLASLHQADRTIGEVMRRLDDDTLLLVVSDHGAAPVTTHLDLATWFRARGARTLAHPVLWTRDPQVAVMVAGNAQAALYAAPGSTRTTRLPWPAARLPGAFGIAGDVVGMLLEEPAVALVAGEAADGIVHVASRGGEATLHRRPSTIDYQPVTGDPLQLGGARSLSPAEWLDASLDTPFPDAAVNLIDQFRSARTGDLVIAASEGHDFREAWERPEHKSGHGSLIAAHMLTPLWSNRPLPDRAFRTVDVFPRLLEHLGVPVPEGIDGD